MCLWFTYLLMSESDSYWMEEVSIETWAQNDLNDCGKGGRRGREAGSVDERLWCLIQAASLL